MFKKVAMNLSNYLIGNFYHLFLFYLEIFLF
jgi:hypothetical protein